VWLLALVLRLVERSTGRTLALLSMVQALLLALQTLYAQRLAALQRTQAVLWLRCNWILILPAAALGQTHRFCV
jgi:hypothetical protein